MNFRKVNNIAGWAVCAIASLVYILTAEMSGSYWDTGEFVAAAYKVQMPHPPGAPLFVLIGRFFIVLFGDSGATAAKAINVMNALASGFTVLFLFWTITHFARKLTSGFLQEPDRGQTFAILGAGVVGALAFTFSDSFWYSAVEGEVYAFSSFFTALAFWAMLKWERADVAAGNSAIGRARADRWIVFIFFSMGLSIGVHLLGLLTIPAIVMIYYFRRYNYTRWGAIWAFVIGCAITGLVQVVVIQISVKLAGWFDILFVNSFGMPFFSGFVFFFLLLGVICWAGLRYARGNNASLLRLGVWCFIFMMLGYSSYVTPLERSNANTAIDMNNVDNPMNLVYYLGREQYGSQPILSGPHFLAQPTNSEQKDAYAKASNKETGKNEYVKYKSPMPNYEYDSRDIQAFARVWDQSRASFYMDWLNLRSGIPVRATARLNGVDREAVSVLEGNGQQYVYSVPEGYTINYQELKGEYQAGDRIPIVKIPTSADNINWFFTYQMGFMYWRYFMWNFAGKQNDVQGFGNARDGNWITGIGVIDNLRLGDQGMMPDSLKKNKAHNSLFLLPFILGIIGCVYQFFKDRKDWITVFLLFFFTGVAIVIYLNQPGSQPRERDYAFAGSYYVYAIWIGLAVVAFARMAREVADKAVLVNTLIAGSIATFFILIMSDFANMNGGKATAALLGTVLFAVATLGVTLLVRAVGKTNFATAALAATAVSLAVPVIMAAQEWDDHDRSQKLLAPDMAKDYLNSCPQNAILFTYGDNDTYPLWYAQEVEGVRPDLRIINTSLLGIDWYVNQLRYKVNESAPINVIWSEAQVRGFGGLGVTKGVVRDNENLLAVMTDIAKQPEILSFPKLRRMIVPVDEAAARKSGIIQGDTSQVLKEIVLDLSGKESYTLDQITMLNVIAANAWKRPICFTNPEQGLGFYNYLEQRGMIYQLTPVQGPRNLYGLGTATDTATYRLLSQNFVGGNAQNRNVYFDEENRSHLLSIREAFGTTAMAFAAEGKKADAVKLLDKSESIISPEAMPYAMAGRRHNIIMMRSYLAAAYAAGHTQLAEKVKNALVKDLNDQLRYYAYLKESKPEYYDQLLYDENEAQQLLARITEMDKQSKGPQAPIVELPQAADSADSGRKR